MKFAIAFVAALASLATLNNAQDTVGDVTCTDARFTLYLHSGLTNTAQNINVEFAGTSSSCTVSGSSSDSAKVKYEMKVVVPAVVVRPQVMQSQLGSHRLVVPLLLSGLVNGKITTGGIELEGKITKGEGKGKIIRIRGKGTSEDERKKESAKCNSWSGYYRIYGDLDTISITDN
ncbi:hypothetical protein GQ42DRAFT_153395 [Ramicandelaber brevisporus]|nr:hypothetical protein GQ42DRAFT_153395 [Ramicandelaber brevisporus]